VFAAQSYDDTDEGFDVRLMQDYSSLRLSVLGPSSWQSCPDANGAASLDEPFTWWAGWEAQ
jgi:hypothetical protein